MLDAACIKWGEDILRDKKLDWKIEWTADENGYSEGITLFDSKTIYIHWPEGEPDYLLMLHEIAHVVCGEKRFPHDSEYAHAYMKLVAEYFIPIVLCDDDPDEVLEFKPRPRKTIKVKLKYKGRSKPIIPEDE